MRLQSLGLVNTIHHIRALSGIERIHGIIGGLHLLNASEERLERTLHFIAECAPDFVTPCHCTGEAATEAFREALGADVISLGRTGLKFYIERLNKQ